MKATSLTVVAIAASLAAPTGAHAATLSMSGSAGPASEFYLLYTADRGEANRVLVNFGARSVSLVDRGVSKIKPAIAGPQRPREVYGSGEFNLQSGQTGAVTVTLNERGRAAVESASPVAVHVTATLPPATGWGPYDPPVTADFGWQTVLGR